MYRLLRADGEVRERRRQATHPSRTVPELVADAPNRVWSYDATALRGPARGVWYDLFVMLDIFSRYCPGAIVVEGQEAQVVRDWIAGVVASQGPIPEGQLSIHADRGSAMTSKAVSALLADLHIGQTHSRPHVCLLTTRTAKLASRRSSTARPSRSASAASSTHAPSPAASSLPTTITTGTRGSATTRPRRSTSAPLPRCGRDGVSSSMPPMPPIPNASPREHPRRRSCLVPPGSTSRRRSTDRASRDDVSHRA